MYTIRQAIAGATKEVLIQWMVLPLLIVALAYVGYGIWNGRYSQTEHNWEGGNLKQIALSYLSYAQSGGKVRRVSWGEKPKESQANSPALLAEILARYTGLTTGEVWYIDRDPALRDVTIPPNVLSNLDDGRNLMLTVRPVSWAVVINRTYWTDRTPMLWTRGLQENGIWSKDSPWQGKGGHIVFGDGRIKWITAIGDLKLEEEDGTPITTLSQLLGPNAIVLEDKVEQIALDHTVDKNTEVQHTSVSGAGEVGGEVTIK